MPTDAFVPLTLPAGASSAAARHDFRLLVAEHPERAQPFRPPAPAAPAALSKPVCEPRVSLQREGERVTGIHIECSCGQVIDLACACETPSL